MFHGLHVGGAPRQLHMRFQSGRFAGVPIVVIALGSLSFPAVAQLNTLPVYYSPAARPGLTLSADYARGLNDDSRKNTALGVRADLALSVVTVGVGLGTVNPHVSPGERSSKFQYMGHAAFRILGGSSVPVAVSVQGGVGYLSYEFTTQTGTIQKVATANIPLGLGIALVLPRTGLSFEPWVAPRYAIHSVQLDGETNAQGGPGLSAGIRLGFARRVGIHAAIDWVSLKEDRSATPNLVSVDPVTIGLGAHYRIRIPGLP